MFEAVERGELIVPCPLVSRGRATFSSDAGSGAGSEEAPWLAVHAGVGPARLLVCWAIGAGSGSREGAGGGPAIYRIESSASSTNGRDGEWRRELSVTQSAAEPHAHVIEFDGQSWVRLTLEAPPRGAAGALPFERLDLHDASDGTDDCWLVLGDPMLAASSPPPPGPSGAAQPGCLELRWPELIHARYPGYFPALVDETRARESPARTLERSRAWLDSPAPPRRVALAYGAASPHAADAAGSALEAIGAGVLQSGRLPVLARQPALPGRARDAADAFNHTIAALERRYRLLPGPDLAAWFDAHPEQLDDDGQPSLEGRRAIARLWADAVDGWYVPQ